MCTRSDTKERLLACFKSLMPKRWLCVFMHNCTIVCLGEAMWWCFMHAGEHPHWLNICVTGCESC